jgi:hypothetical protein
MADSYKDIIITPNRSNTADPKIEFRGGNSSVNTAITVQTYPTSNGTLSFEGSAGQLFSITNDLTGSIYSVNDVSGIPSIEVFANGQIDLAPYGGTVKLKSYDEYINANTATTGATTLDISSGNFFNLTLTGNTTFTYTNAPTGRMVSFTIAVKQDATGGRTITWPSGTKWPGGVAPPATTAANAIDIWSVMTYDGGSTWVSSLSIKNVS